MTAPRPLDAHDDINWHEDGVWLRKYGCWPFFAVIVLSWAAIGFTVWSLWA